MPKRFPTLAAMFVAGAAVAWSPFATAQDAVPKDDALDKLLEKLDDSTSTPPPAVKPAESGDAKAEDGKAPEPETPGEAISEKDKALDSLLEKLGQTTEEASPDDDKDARPGGPGEGPPPTSLKPEEATKLDKKDAELDEHLRDLTGRKSKPKNQKKQGDGQGPLSEAIKKMVEAEERLKKTDTGEQTRKTQGEIVKQLDSILEQLRKASGSGKGQGKPMARLTQAGNQPGDKPGGEQPGNTGAGVGAMKPAKPTAKSVLNNSKDTWGDLPPSLREEMENVFKEEALPGKQRLIDRYFLTVSKKSIAAKE
jgi:hypothetical protein